MPIFGAKNRAARGCASKLACGRRIDPAVRNHKNANPIGDHAQCLVGADASVRPWGNCGFAATLRKNGRAACGESAASTPTNIAHVRIGAFVFAGASSRADRGVRPYGCIPFCIGAFNFVTLCRAGGVEPRPYGKFVGFFAVLHPCKNARRDISTGETILFYDPPIFDGLCAFHLLGYTRSLSNASALHIPGGAPPQRAATPNPSP